MGSKWWILGILGDLANFKWRFCDFHCAPVVFRKGFGSKATCIWLLIVAMDSPPPDPGFMAD